MYDTVSAVLDEVPPGVSACKSWSRSKITEDRQTGAVQARLIYSADGLSLTLFDAGRLQVERSLPKALTGQNVVDLRDDQVADAIAVVDQELGGVLGVAGLPSIAEWSPARVDYCCSMRLGSEERVALELRRLGDVHLPRKGRAVRGESGSLRWSHGAEKPKVYGKYLETGGDPMALGVLRYEVAVHHKRRFRTLLGRAPGRPVALREVLTESIRDQVLGRYQPSFAEVAMSKDEMGDLEFVREFLGFFGAGRGFQLYGWCVYWALSGYRTFAELEKVAGEQDWNRSSRYRALQDLRKFRAYLRAKEQDPGSVEAIATRLAKTRELVA